MDWTVAQTRRVTAFMSRTVVALDAQAREGRSQSASDFATVSRWTGAFPKLASPASARRW